MPRCLVFAVVLSVTALLPEARASDIGCAYAALADGRSFDPVSGADPNQYPPDPQVRFEHIRLELRFDDLAGKSFTCLETIRFRTLARPIRELKLDAVDLRIRTVSTLDGPALPFRADDQHLVIVFDPELSPERAADLVIEYQCRDPKAGMIFAVPDEAYPDRPLVIHTQGETETNRYWFVCHDYPNARCTSEAIVTMPARSGAGHAYVAVSNGRLVERTELDGGRVRYHYFQEQPHVSYLIALALGELAVVRDEWRGKPVEYYLPVQQKDRARLTFGKTPEMIELYSRLLGVDYPYAKYAQVVCPLFHSGGMENTSMTVLREDVALDERAAVDQDQEGLISHELAHQWLGDMVTCKSWPHIWLNEGFAQFMEMVWFERSRSPDEYAGFLWHTLGEVIKADPVEEGAGGVVWSGYENPWELFRRRGKYPYTKGCCVLHMLRCHLGEELFWQTVREYLKRFAWKAADTDDFRKVVEELSGRSYEQFFQQWLYRTGVPKIRAGYEWKDGQARVSLEQTQTVSAAAPAFVGDVEVWLVDEQGAVSKAVAEMKGRSASVFVSAKGEPAQVVIDPRAGLIADYELELPLKMLTREALSGPTVIARLRAIAALRHKDQDESREVLARALGDEQTFWGLRAAAAEALGGMQCPEARDVLLQALADGHAIQYPKARRAAIRALGTYRHARVTETLLRFARQDASYAVQAAANEALGNQQATDQVFAVLLANTRTPSYGDVIRQGAVGAMARMDDLRGLPAAIELAGYGQPYLSRPAGIAALGRLGRQEPARLQVRRVLTDLLADPQDRAVSAAIAALSEMGDEQAIPRLRLFAEGSAQEMQRRAAREAIAEIGRKNREPVGLKDLRERVERLEKAREADEKRLTGLESTTRPGATQPAATQPAIHAE